MVIPELPLTLRYRVIALAWDDFEGEDIYLYWLMNKCTISNRENVSAVDNNVLTYPYTFSAKYDKAAGSSASFGICGPGWQAVSATRRHRIRIVSEKDDDSSDDTSGTPQASAG